MNTNRFKNIFLAGMPGSGKTTTGKFLAKKYNLKFVDSDHYIESSIGKKISEIFNTHGEGFFRELEKKTLQEISEDTEKKIVSLGGGTPCNEENLSLIKSNGLLIYIQLPPKALAQRIYQNPDSRPMFTGLDLNEINELLVNLLNSREKFYLSADLIVNGLDLDQNELYNKINSLVNISHV